MQFAVSFYSLTSGGFGTRPGPACLKGISFAPLAGVKEN